MQQVLAARDLLAEVLRPGSIGIDGVGPKEGATQERASRQERRGECELRDQESRSPDAAPPGDVRAADAKLPSRAEGGHEAEETSRDRGREAFGLRVKTLSNELLASRKSSSKPSP